MFKKAVKKQLKAKIMMDGPSGSGKTYGALLIAQGLAGKDGKIGLIDSENRSASLYASIFDFDVCDLKAPFSPENYINTILEAIKHFDVIVIDSISHEWSGEGGCLDIHTKIGGNTFTAWNQVTPRHNKFINTIINADTHIISTCRTKTGYEMGNNKGKATVTKVGLQPITRDGFEYENTVVFTLNENNFAKSTKDRTSLFNGKDFQITKETGEQLLKWLNNGEKEEIDFKGPIDKMFKNPSEKTIDNCMDWLEDNKAPDDIMDYFFKLQNEYFEKREQLEKETGQ